MRSMPHVNEAVAHCLDQVMTRGMESAPRGKPVRELIGQSITSDMRFPLCTLTKRKMGYKFAPAEAAWILNGRNDLAFFKSLKMPFIWEFSDDGFFYQGAYGPQVVEQLSYVCDVLSGDHDTRQAVMTIWRQNPRPSRDIPCTLSYQFIARGGALHVIQSMRSSDVWLGYPYDAFNAAMLAGYIILLLRDRGERGRSPLCLGHHTMMIGSQHIYEPNWQGALDVVESPAVDFNYERFNPFFFDSPDHLLLHLQLLAMGRYDECRPDMFLTNELRNHAARSAKSS